MGEVQNTYELFKLYLPNDAEFEIIETDCRLIAKYLYRATYRSKRTHRMVTVTSKSNYLPRTYFELLPHLLEISLTPKEQGKKFSTIAWYEKRARQDAFLFGGGKLRGNDIRVTTEENKQELLTYENYS